MGRKSSFQILCSITCVSSAATLGVASVRKTIFARRKGSFATVPFARSDIFRCFSLRKGDLEGTFLGTPLSFFHVASHFAGTHFRPVLGHCQTRRKMSCTTPIKARIGDVKTKAIVTGNCVNKKNRALGMGRGSMCAASCVRLDGCTGSVRINDRIRRKRIVNCINSAKLSAKPRLSFQMCGGKRPVGPLRVRTPPSLPIGPRLHSDFTVIGRAILTRLSDVEMGGGLWC